MSRVKQAQVQTGPEQDAVIEQKIQQLRELFADAPEVGKKALENVLQELTSQASEAEGAASVVWGAVIPDDGPTGGFFRDGEPLSW